MGINVASSFTRNAPVPIDDSFVVADLTARDAIASGVRYEGMFCYVESEAANFQLVGGISNGNWEDFAGGSGGGSGNLSDYSVDDSPSPTDGFVSNIPVKTFSSLEDQSIFFYIPLSGYKPGNKIALENLLISSDSPLANSVLFLAETTLVQPGDDVTALVNTHTSTNTFVLNSQYILASIGQLDLTDSAGEINSVAVADGDALLVRIYRDNSVGSNLSADVNLYIKNLKLNMKAA